jgi:hypothetical protein
MISASLTGLARLYRTLVAAIGVVVVAGCAAGVAEFAIYEDSFDRQVAKAESIFDRLADAERNLARRSILLGDDLAYFDPDFAGYYLDTGDPPITASLRASLRAVAQYNDVLLGLSNGEGAAALRSRAAGIVTILEVGTEPFSSQDGGEDAAAATRARLNSLCTSCTTIVGTLKELSPVFGELANLKSYAEFRSAVLAQHDNMGMLLTTLRNGTPDIYGVFVTANSGNSLAEGQGIRSDAIDNVRQFRLDLAEWVLLIDQTILAMDAAVAAVQDPNGFSAAELLQRSIIMREIEAAN